MILETELTFTCPVMVVMPVTLLMRYCPCKVPLLLFLTRRQIGEYFLVPPNSYILGD